MRTNSSPATQPTTKNSKPSGVRRRPRRFSILEPQESNGPQVYKSDLDVMTPEQRKAHMRRMLPRYKQVCAEMMPQVDAAREARAAHRAAAAGRQVERRGGGRPVAKRARSGRDSDDESSDEAEQPPCGCDPSTYHLNGSGAAHTDACRKRTQRDRERARDEPAIDAPPQPGTYTMHSTAEYEALKRRIIDVGCRCNGHHIAAARGDEPSPRCVKCGHRLGPLTNDWTSADKLKSRPVVIHKVAVRRKPPRYGDRKRKPVVHGRLPSGEVVPV